MPLLIEIEIVILGQTISVPIRTYAVINILDVNV